MQTAALIGADVPFCLIGGTARYRGIGEQIEVLDTLPAGRYYWHCRRLGSQLPALTGNWIVIATVAKTGHCTSNTGD